MFTSNSRFNINDHLDKLTPAKEKGKYICPACNGHNLSINSKTGKYNCWNCRDTKKIKDILTAASQDQPPKKSPREKKTSYFNYPDRQGNPLIRVVRIDDGRGKKKIYQQHWNGKKWVKGYGPVKTSDIPLYRYREVKSAIAQGQQIVLAEGESTVDVFWSKGIPATTIIGGTGKTVVKKQEGLTCWVEPNHEAFQTIQAALADLAEAHMILAPDCDKPGCLHMEMVAEVVPVSGWLYAFPDSFQWSRLPDKEGLDFVDWIHDYPNLTAEEILNTIQPEPKHQWNEPAMSPKSQVVSGLNALFNKEDYEQAVSQLLTQNLTEAQLELEIQAVAHKFKRTDIQVWRLYHKLCGESDKAENLADIAEELHALLESQNATIKLEDYLPGNLIKIKEIYQRLCLRPEIGLMQFLSACSGLLPVGSKIDLIDFTDFDQPMGIYFTVCAEPSQRKTPGQKIIATKPLKILQKEADSQYKEELAEYKRELAEWEKNGQNDGDPPPIEPTRRIYFINSATQAGLRNLLQKQQNHGLVILYDELASDFRNRSKKYNAGLTEDLLSYYDGSGKREAIAEGFAGDFDEVLISLQGAIQPGVVEEFLNGDNDPNGYWARLNIINQPTRPCLIPEDPSLRGPKTNLTPLLVDHYKKVANLPKLHLKLDSAAEDLFVKIYNKCELNKVSAPTQSIATQWGKLSGKIGRLAALIHITEQVHYFGKVENLEVSSKTLLKATNLGYFLLNEARSLYADNSPDNLASHLKKILEVTKRVKQPLSAGKIKNLIWPFKKAKTSLDTIHSYFEDLVKLGYGKIVGSGVGRKFQLLFGGKGEKVEAGGEPLIPPQPPSVQQSPPTVEKVEGLETSTTGVDNIPSSNPANNRQNTTPTETGENPLPPLSSLPNDSNPDGEPTVEGRESSTQSSTLSTPSPKSPKSSTSPPDSSTKGNEPETTRVQGESTPPESSTLSSESETLGSQPETTRVQGESTSPESSTESPEGSSPGSQPETTRVQGEITSPQSSTSSPQSSMSRSEPETTADEVLSSTPTSTESPKSSSWGSETETISPEGSSSANEPETTSPEGSSSANEPQTTSADGDRSSPKVSNSSRESSDLEREAFTVSSDEERSFTESSNSSTEGLNSATPPEMDSSSSERGVEAISGDGEESPQESSTESPEPSSSANEPEAISGNGEGSSTEPPTPSEGREIRVGSRIGFKNVWGQIQTGVVLDITETDQIVTLRLDNGIEKMIYLEEAFLL